MKLADRMNRLGTETAFLVLAKAKKLEAQGKEIIHLEIGEPDFNTPQNIIDAAIDALKSGQTHYNPASGIAELRKILAEDSNKWRGAKFSSEHVVVTPGAKPIMFFSILALINEGDEVIYPNPGFPIYESVIKFVGAKAVPLPLKEEHDFRFSIDDLKRSITPKTRMIILNSPQNPTGGILTREDLEGVADLTYGKNIWILSDEVYKEMVYEGQHFSIASLPDMEKQTIILDGFSKTYAMTGWRLGYGIMPEELAENITKLAINCTSCTATFTQYAGVEAIKGPQDASAKMIAEFKKRRNVIVDGLNQISGISCLRPKGAFYVFPNISKLPRTSSQLETFLLEEAGVAVLSGTAFGKYGDGYLRLSYANSIENINKALQRIESALAKLS
ncbi:pyridoxal phosphate-dependent aminotransferase [candidate division KSB1 bacterium]|nr:pyridoxal phosphate-dependent aminotransferase [candidate division KSB1 bacterium]